MRKFHIPTKEEVPERDRKRFYVLEENMGKVPNVYAFLTHSETALGSFLAFNGTPTAFCAQEVEIVSLITSQINRCQYCLSAHSLMAKNTGLTDEQIIEIRKGNVPFNQKWDTLAKMTCEMVNHHGEVRPETIDRFYEAGYTDAHLVDLVMVIARTIITNYTNNVIHTPLDFPEVPVLVCDCDCGK